MSSNYDKEKLDQGSTRSTTAGIDASHKANITDENSQSYYADLESKDNGKEIETGPDPVEGIEEPDETSRPLVESDEGGEVFAVAKQVEDKSALNASVVQFLALYLLILAFFIWLVSLARFEGVKSLAVINSLKSTFETKQKEEEKDITTIITAKILSAKQFEDNIRGLFSTLLGVEKVEAPTPGQNMRVVMRADTLFEKEKTKIKEFNYKFMDRVVASLSERPPGYHFDVEFIVRSKQDSSGYGTLPTDQTLQMARAGNFVRTMLERGAPPDSVSIGVREGNPQRIVLWFHIRSPLEVDSYYKSLKSSSSQAVN